MVPLGEVEGPFCEGQVELGGVGVCLLMQVDVDVLQEESTKVLDYVVIMLLRELKFVSHTLTIGWTWRV